MRQGRGQGVSVLHEVTVAVLGTVIKDGSTKGMLEKDIK